MRSDFPVPEKDVRQGELKALANVGGGDVRLVQPAVNDNDVVLHGDYRRECLRPGLVLHATDMCQLYDLTSHAVQNPGITFSLFMCGGATASVGDRNFVMGSMGDREPAALEAVAISRTRSESFTRSSPRGKRIRKVIVNISPEWLEDGGLGGIQDHAAISSFSQDHLASVRWLPSQRLVSLAEQILRPPPLLPLLRNLYNESRAIEFVGEAFQAISQSMQDSAAQLRPSDYRRIETVCEFLEENLNVPLTLRVIASQAGLSVSTLQRLFRAVHGTTVFEYIRDRKLQCARQALEADGVSVAQAAFIAGYASAANFATAFKRQFGITPKSARSHF